MSRLTKYLESLMSKKDSLKQSETTSSVYYTIDRVKIRVSDHFTSSSKCDISIINPLNKSTTYLVQVKEGPQILQFSLKDLKTFITNYCFVRKIASLHEEVIELKEEKKLILKSQIEQERKEIKKVLHNNFKTFSEFLSETQDKAKTKKEKNVNYLLSKLPFTSDGLTWLEITTKLSTLFPKYSTITKGCKNVLRDYLYNRSTDEIKDLMVYFFNNNKFKDSDKLKHYFLYEETKGE